MEYKEDIPFHPSYGYSTKEQIQLLFDLKSGTEYENLKKQILFQTNKKGKVKGLMFNAIVLSPGGFNIIEEGSGFIHGV